jgi:hypothetical protein
MRASLGWIPRNQNVEADAGTNGDYRYFSPENRVEVKWKELEWILLPEFMEAGKLLYREIALVKAKRSDRRLRGDRSTSRTPPPKRRPEDKLTTKDPG